MHHLPFIHHISTTIAPNLARSGLFEIRHSELSKHIKFEEKGAQKGLQTAERRADQKLKKKGKKERQNSLIRWQKIRG